MHSSYRGNEYQLQPNHLVGPGTPKCKFFSWLAVQNRIRTPDRLSTRGWPHNPTCSLCCRCLETGNHFFVDCRFTRRIWAVLSFWLGEPRDKLEMHKLGPRVVVGGGCNKRSFAQGFKISCHSRMLGDLE